MDVSVVIKTFNRPHLAVDCVRRFAGVFASENIFLVDDSTVPFAWPPFVDNVAIVSLPPDVGISAGRNAGISKVRTGFTLLTDDSSAPRFDRQQFSAAFDAMVRSGYDIIGSDYSGWKFNRNRKVLSITRVKPAHTDFSPVDLVGNFFVAKTSVLISLGYDERMKIGGEHVDFFLRALHNGVSVATCPWIPFIHTHRRNTDYTGFRNRASRYLRMAKAKHGLTGIKWDPTIRT